MTEHVQCVAQGQQLPTDAANCWDPTCDLGAPEQSLVNSKGHSASGKTLAISGLNAEEGGCQWFVACHLAHKNRPLPLRFE